MRRMKSDTPQAALKRLVKNSNSQADAARQLEISQPYLIDLLRGRRNFSEAMADKLGFRRVWIAK